MFSVISHTLLVHFPRRVGDPCAQLSVVIWYGNIMWSNCPDDTDLANHILPCRLDPSSPFVSVRQFNVKNFRVGILLEIVSTAARFAPISRVTTSCILSCDDRSSRTTRRPRPAEGVELCEFPSDPALLLAGSPTGIPHTRSSSMHSLVFGKLWWIGITNNSQFVSLTPPNTGPVSRLT